VDISALRIVSACKGRVMIVENTLKGVGNEEDYVKGGRWNGKSLGEGSRGREIWHACISSNTADERHETYGRM
jgi:hypothetical protein